MDKSYKPSEKCVRCGGALSMYAGAHNCFRNVHLENRGKNTQGKEVYEAVIEWWCVKCAFKAMADVYGYEKKKEAKT